MSTSSIQLDVEHVRTLSLTRHDWLRIDILPNTDVTEEELLRGEYKGPIPLPGEVRQGGRLGDLIGTFWASVFAVTGTFIDSLRRLEATGWRAYPIASDGATDVGSDIYLLGITGRSGPVYSGDLAARHGLDPISQFLDPGKWDGSDLFLPSNRTSILVAAPLAASLETMMLRNVVLEPAGLQTTPSNL
jgi:hypothetical protein